MYPDKYDLNYQDNTRISFFSLPYESFNNWSAHIIKLWGHVFPTAEHAFQYAKFIDNHPDIATMILQAESPWRVYQITNQYRALSPNDWSSKKVKIMKEIITAKVHQHGDVRERLMSTGSLEIAENSPWDDFWGLGPKGDGENMLGKIYMDIRTKINSGS